MQNMNILNDLIKNRVEFFFKDMIGNQSKDIKHSDLWSCTNNVIAKVYKHNLENDRNNQLPVLFAWELKSKVTKAFDRLEESI